MGKLADTLRSGLWITAFSALIAGPAWGDSGVSTDPQRATYRDVQAFMRQVVAQYPSNVRLTSIGTSDTGEAIEALVIGTGPVHNVVVATHHGNEYGATEVARAFAASIAERPIPGQTLYVIPVLNISGYNSKSRWERSKDPNRNYPGPCGTEGPLTLRSTAALAQFIERENIVTSATLHTFFPAVVYPWGLATRDLSTPYDGLFKGLVQDATVESKYEVGNSTEVIYSANGTYEDYAFWKHGVWSLLFELGESHSPNRQQVLRMAEVNVPGMRRFLEKAPQARAENHAFTGSCDARLLNDRHDE